MNYETKRNVFGQLLNAYQNLIMKDIQIPDENYRENITTPWNIVYDAALPDDLPVIPVEIANAIEEYRDRFGSAKGLNELITDMNVPWKLGVLETVTAIPEIILGVFRSKADVLARAWLDGYQIDNKS